MQDHITQQKNSNQLYGETKTMPYRLTLSVDRTGVAFMYHSTKTHQEALNWMEKYNKFEGVTVTMERT